MLNLFRCRALGCVLAGSLAGCATFHPSLSMTCRDPSTGRFVSCGGGGGGGGDSGDALLAVGILGGIAAVAGVVYLVSRASSDAPPTPTPRAEAAAIAPGRCVLPVREVMVCQSSRGYRFALPAPGPCAPGSRPVGLAPLTCEALNRPAYHACLDSAGAWFGIRSWETCGARGLSDAPGDFVPPGRAPEQGVAPDSWQRPPPQLASNPGLLQCFTTSGEPVTVDAVTCFAAGHLDAAPGAPPTPPTPQRPRILRCYTLAGNVVPTEAPSCGAAGHLDAPPLPH